MDKNRQAITEKMLERTADALRKNRFGAFVIRSREELIEKLRELMPDGISCSVGGSVTLFEAGVVDFIKAGNYRYFDRYAEGAVGAEVYHQALGCDVYLMSSNAITEDGRLYNVDGNGNRVAALVYGPEKVIVVAGRNKIVPDLTAARERNRRIAAPANAVRLNKTEIPCYHTGVCADCNSPGRFCASELVTHCQMREGRVTLLLVNEDLGY